MALTIRGLVERYESESQVNLPQHSRRSGRLALSQPPVTSKPFPQWMHLDAPEHMLAMTALATKTSAQNLSEVLANGKCLSLRRQRKLQLRRQKTDDLRHIIGLEANIVV